VLPCWVPDAAADWQDGLHNRGVIMKLSKAVTILLTIGAFVGTPTRSFAQSEDAVAKQFIGMWRLVSQPQRFADGTVKQDPKSEAYIIYTDTGHMCYVAMDPRRPRWKSTGTPTPEEALTAIAGFGAYCGRVEMHASEGFVLHHVEIAGSPNFVGQTFKRWFTFDGPNRVSLRLDGLAPPKVEETLIWERVQKR
jgi:Lipocalin-like domain